jgi:flagellin-like hook-associated protein FlgL
LINQDFLREITCLDAKKLRSISRSNVIALVDQKGSNMSGITLSAGVRQNLLALQNTSAEAILTQGRLATGKKVNTALDNPSSFFTSQSLSARASDLGTLLDAIGQATSTLQATDQGITSLTALVQSAKSIATQAEQGTKGVVNYTNITGSVAIAADRSRVTGPVSVATGDATANASVHGSYTINASSLAGAASGDTLQLTNGTTTTTFQYLTGTHTATGSNVGFTNAATLAADITAAFTAATVGNNAGTITVSSTSAQDYTTNYTATGTATLTGLGSSVSATDGDKLTVNDGSHTSIFRYVSAGASAANGTFTDATSLAAAINNGASLVSTDVTAANVTGGKLQLDAAKTVSITVGGTLGTAYGFASTATSDNYNSTLAGLSGTTLTVQVGTDAVNTLTFGTGNGQIASATQLSTALGAITDIAGSINSSNQINFAPNSSAAVTVGGAATSGLGLTPGTTVPVGTVVTPDATRTSLQTQYNALLTQIDQLAGDSSYNGVNLLSGDNLKVTFDEKGTASLTISGVNFNSAGLGLTAISGTGFQDNNFITNTLTTINTALSTLRAQASTFGSNLSTVQTRQDFTKNLIATLQTGSDNLVLADTNQEGANLLALQTRQQLSTTALSLSVQSDQAILKIL